MLRPTRRTLLVSSVATTLCLSPGLRAMISSGRPASVRKLTGNAAHSSSWLGVNLTLNNLDKSNSYTAPNVSYGHAFADGDVPPGGSVVLTDSTGAQVVSQMDAVSLWPSGCARFVIISHVCAEVFAPGAILTYNMESSEMPPDNTPSPSWGNSPEATMVANTDFTVEYSGFDAGADTYTVSFNSILSSYRSSPWGTSYPLGGWERSKVGPACMEWHAWEYIRNDKTGRPHGYVRCDLWIKAWSPTGPFEIDVRTSQPNMWNAISAKSERYNVSPGRWAAICTVRNGSNVVQYAGGAGDYRAATISNRRFNTSSNQIMLSDNSLVPQGGIVFESSGSLPAGISTDTIYWLAYVAGKNPYICTERFFASMAESECQTWQPNTKYSLDAAVVNNNICYLCTQAGTSGLSGGPVGTGSGIPDGSCQWQSMSIPFTDQGSGRITAYPVNACFPSSAWVTGDPNGNPLWCGPGYRPPIFPGHDFQYLTTLSKFVPPFNINARFKTTHQRLNAYNPNQNFGGLVWYQDTTGDGPADQRIGYVDGWGVTALMNPSDPFYTLSSLQSALCFNNAPYSYMVDERGGMPFVGNNGHKASGKAYRHLPTLIPDWAANNTPGKTPAFGVGNWLPWSTAFQDMSGYSFRPQYYVDSSHQPAPWQIPYLKTGRPCFLEQGIHLGNTNCFMQYETHASLGSANYYCVVNTSYESHVQVRGWAWALRSLSQALHVTPAAHPFHAVLSDYYDDNAAYQASYYTNFVPTEAVALGCLNVADYKPGAIHSWQTYFLFISVAMEVWRGNLSRNKNTGRNWKVLLDYMNGWWSVLGSNQPKSFYYAGLYTFAYSPNSQGLATAYQTSADALTATFQNAVALADPGLAEPYPATGLYDKSDSGYTYNGGYPEGCTYYGVIGQAALKMCCVAEPSDSTLATLYSNFQSYIADTTGISAERGGIQWCGSYDGHMQNYHTFAIF